jgi:hypothetical protein
MRHFADEHLFRSSQRERGAFKVGDLSTPSASIKACANRSA